MHRFKRFLFSTAIASTSQNAVIVLIYILFVFTHCIHTTLCNTLTTAFEGFSGTCYTDTAGVKTIGYGHACQVTVNRYFSNRY
jgi:hypothetical protein